VTVDSWAGTILQVLRTHYPYAAGHISRSADDIDVRPDRLHPIFHGSFDWHSSAHMQWSAVNLLDRPELDPELRHDLIGELDSRLTPDNGAIEAAYLRERPGFERPYGWAWAAMLAAVVQRSAAPEAVRWQTATYPIAEVIADNLTAWLPKLAYPVRHGVHSNTAFALILALQAYDNLGRGDITASIMERASGWFGQDRDYPSQWEPSGADFLSPALCEAELMSRVLPEQDFRGWLAGFLPALGADDDNLLLTPVVLDHQDGHAVHLFGLALSRAWLLRSLSRFVDADRSDRMLQAAGRLVAAPQAEISGGNFMSTHWLVSFALLAGS
jgi:hypothetical protein